MKKDPDIIQLVKLLLDKKVELGHTNNDGMGAFYFAIDIKNKKLIRWLVKLQGE